MTTALDLFAGPGGWSVACHTLGITERGVEWDAAACTTARAAGHHRWQGDVRWFTPWEPFDGLIASPPCQTFSTAGKGEGRAALDRLVVGVGLVAAGATPAAAIGDDAPIVTWDDDEDDGLFGMPPALDYRTGLVLEPMRFVRDYLPTWVVLEQVPAVLPVWQAYASTMTRFGYNTAVGILSAEQFGVPQTRRRAILIAHMDRPVGMPTPTHSRYYPENPTKLDDGVLPWVSMADALGWAPDALVGFPRRADDRDTVTIGGVDYRSRDLFDASGPAPHVTGKVRSWAVFRGSGNAGESGITAKGTAVWQPAVNDQSGTPRDALWPTTRPATTVAGRDIIPDPGTNANRFNGATKSRNDGVRVTVSEAGVLQGFPPDYPWSGTRTERHQQVGDAIPPALAAAILREVVDDDRDHQEAAP